MVLTEPVVVATLERAPADSNDSSGGFRGKVCPHHSAVFIH
jgi:hypothetical protein